MLKIKTKLSREELEAKLKPMQEELERIQQERRDLKAHIIESDSRFRQLGKQIRVLMEEMREDVNDLNMMKKREELLARRGK